MSISLYEEAKYAVKQHSSIDEAYGYTSTQGDLNKGSRAQTMQGNMLLYMVDSLSTHLDKISKKLDEVSSRPVSDISKKEIDTRLELLFNEQNALKAQVSLLSDRLDKFFKNLQSSLNQQTTDLAKIARGENVPKASIELSELDKQRLVEQFESTFSKIGKGSGNTYKNSGKYASLIEE